MSDERESVGTSGEGTPRWLGLSVIALAAISIIGLGVGWNASTHATSAEQALAGQTKSVQSFQQNVDTLGQRLSQAEETNAQLQSELKVVTDRLKITQGQLSSAKQQTQQIRSDYSQKIDNVQNQLAAKANTDDVTALGGDVNGVKTDLEATKNNLQMARGELGTLIAKDHDQIDELRRMGERDYFEFTLAGKGNRSKAGTLMLELRGTNTKKNQFSVALYVDDMRLEKKDRPVDEPIYFYTRGTHAPLELVVNQVGKDKIVGYVSVPKGRPAGATSASAGAGN